MANLFIYLQEDYVLTDQSIVKQNEVGIVNADDWRNNDILDCRVFLIPEWREVLLEKPKLNLFDPSKTGDGFINKVCNVCHKLLPTDKFAKNQNGINNRSVRRPSCQDCRKHIEGKDLSAKDKKLWGAKKPNLTPFECPICKKRTIAGVTSKVVLDHDHATGKPREWICDSCNTGIGRFKDSVELLKKAIEFIESF